MDHAAVTGYGGDSLLLLVDQLRWRYPQQVTRGELPGK
jgi:hypothetical protein